MTANSTQPPVQENNLVASSDAKRLGSRLRRRLGIFCLAGVILGWAIWWIGHETNQHYLLNHAERVAEVGDSAQEKKWANRYWWLSPHEVVLVRGDFEKHQPLSFLRKDLQTGTEQPLTALSQLYNRSG